LVLGALILPNSSANGLFLARYDSTGGVRAARQVAYCDENVYVIQHDGLGIDQAGTIYISGTFYSSNVIVSGINFTNSNVPFEGHADFFVAAFDADLAGAPSFALAGQGPAPPFFNGLAVNAWGDCYVAGGFSSEFGSTLTMGTTTVT